MLNQKTSEELTPIFDEYYPGGHSNFRCKLDAGGTKLFMKAAKGAHVWDVDDNMYIEYNGAMGPLMLGHGYPKLIDEMTDYIHKEATIYGTNLLYRPDDIELAKLLCDYIPCAEAVKLCVTGTEAVQMAFRLARAYTGKNRVLKFGDMYHGWLDNVLYNAADPNVDIDSGELPLPIETPKDSWTYTTGKAPWTREESFVIPYNDLDMLEKTIEKYHDEIAICHVEAMCSDDYCLHPQPGYLERLRELCTQYNIVLSFDEVITGFRLGLGGAQEYFGVIPDICTLGKALTAGFAPMSTVVGKKEIFDTFHKKAVIGAGTFNGYGLGVKAAVTALKIYKENDGAIYKQIDQIKERLIEGFLASAEKYHVPLTICDAPAMFYTVFGVGLGRIKLTDRHAIDGMDNEFYERFRYHLMEEGVVVMILARWFIGGGHTMEDAEKTIVAFDNAMAKTVAEFPERYK